MRSYPEQLSMSVKRIVKKIHFLDQQHCSQPIAGGSKVRATAPTQWDKSSFPLMTTLISDAEYRSHTGTIPSFTLKKIYFSVLLQ